MKKNQWQVHESIDDGERYASWKIYFPTTAMLDHRKMWEFEREVLALGEENQIIQITETSRLSEFEKQYYFNLDRGESFTDFIGRVLEEEDKLIGRSDYAHVQVSTNLCYYGATGELLEKEVAYPAIALEENRPDLIADHDYYLAKEDAIQITTFTGIKKIEHNTYDEEEYEEEICATETDEERKEYEDRHFKEYCFIEDEIAYVKSRMRIFTNTDIWFPKVVGGYDEYLKNRGWFSINDQGERINEKEGEWYDNSEIALRNTPKFNNFIRQVKKLVLEHGGTWECCDFVDPTYCSQWDENGIILPE
jgi:hypothetical protein